MKFNRLTALEPCGKQGGRTMWLCQCDCGKQKTIRSDHLQTGRIKSCGCYAPGAPTHRLYNSRHYHIWTNMKMRCYNKRDPRYPDYGGRGIKVCDEWLNSFESFYSWAIGNGYSDNLTLDRIDVNGNYEPSNCKWSTKKEQNNNKRNNHLITYNGETNTISEWAKAKGIKPHTLYMRIVVYGWSVERALETT